MAIGTFDLSRLQNPQLLALIVAVSTAAALLGGAWMWSQTPDYRALYANVSDRDGGAIIAALQQMNVPYKLEGGAIQVPADKVHEARLKLAGLGIPKSDVAGFELMENPKLGTSQFLEQVNYQRALEGELVRSIQSVSVIQSARVHLALAKPSVFVRDQPESSASVLVVLRPGRSLDSAQVAAITHMVSSSVPGLSLKNVSVVDQDGSLLSDVSNPADLPDPAQLKYAHELEAGYIRRIEDILLPIVGAGNVRAQVTAEIDYTQTERAEELYEPNTDPKNTTMRSTQSSESSSSNGAQPGGVPGAASNQPPAAGQAGKGAAGSQATNGSQENQKTNAVNYEVDKAIQHVKTASGGVKRLSVGVVVNQRQRVDAKGKVTYEPLSAEVMAQINALVKEAMGYNEARGDTVNVTNSLFNKPPEEVIPEPPFWQDPGNIELAKEIGKHTLIAGAMLYLLLGIVRPAWRKMAKPPVPPVAAEPEANHLPEAAMAEQNGPTAQDLSLERAKQLAREDPKLMANVVKSWVGADGS